MCTWIMDLVAGSQDCQEGEAAACDKGRGLAKYTLCRPLFGYAKDWIPRNRFLSAAAAS